MVHAACSGGCARADPAIRWVRDSSSANRWNWHAKRSRRGGISARLAAVAYSVTAAGFESGPALTSSVSGFKLWGNMTMNRSRRSPRPTDLIRRPTLTAILLGGTRGRQSDGEQIGIPIAPIAR